jgi:SAM-dependent methyltransferase
MGNVLDVLKRVIKKAIYSRAVSRALSMLRIRDSYLCPICNYYGIFQDFKVVTGKRKNAKCPKCGALERHRLQYLVFKKATVGVNTKEMSMLHFAPEDFFRKIFQGMFGTYVTADITGAGVDRKEDLTKMSFGDNSFDFIFASHVLEHILDDTAALSQVRRVLKPGGIAMLAVPVIGKRTAEYGKPNPYEGGHVRCPGEDYFRKYEMFFSSVKLYRSGDFDEKYQLYTYEHRAQWPETMPDRPVVPGEKHVDIVPICIKQ